MKTEAAKGTGQYFGMTERYDQADIGLNPILYWSKDNFQAVKRKDVEGTTSDDKNNGRMYTKAEYIMR